MDLTAALLATERPLTAAEIGARVPGYPDDKTAFRRAFERDKEELRERSVPLVVEAVPGTDPPVDGYRIDRDRYYLPDPGLEPDELAALHLAARAVRAEGDTGRGALRKLGGVLDTAPTGDEALADVPSSPAVDALFAAISERRLARFDYRGTPREVEPRRLDFQRGRWYLTAHDRLRDDERNFRIDRIDGDVELDEAGSAPERPPGRPRWTHPWELGEGPTFEARLLVDSDHVAPVAAVVGEAAVVEHRDSGAAVFGFTVSEPEAFRSFVLDLLDHAEILEPDTARSDLIAWLEALTR